MRLKAEDDKKIILLYVVLLHCTESMNIFELPRRELEKNIKLAIICSLFSPIYNISKQSKYQEVSLRMQILFVFSCYNV